MTIPSTDYRDLRKAAFQEYSIASSFNTIRLPHNVSAESGSILGVAFVSAVLALGICMGVSFESVEEGPDLLKIVRNIDPERLPADIRKECLENISEEERARPGSYLIIWGGSSTSAHLTKQIARLTGLKIVSVVDHAKHGIRLSSNAATRADLLVDSHDPERAIDIIKRATKDGARFGFDTQGKESAAHLLRSLASSTSPIESLPQLRAQRLQTAHAAIDTFRIRRRCAAITSGWIDGITKDRYSGRCNTAQRAYQTLPRGTRGWRSTECLVRKVALEGFVGATGRHRNRGRIRCYQRRSRSDEEKGDQWRSSSSCITLSFFF